LGESLPVGACNVARVASGRGAIAKLDPHRPQRLRPVRLRQGESVSAALARFRADPAIAYAQPNFIYRAQAVARRQWALRNVGRRRTSRRRR
jgi:hypothetical protein